MNKKNINFAARHTNKASCCGNASCLPSAKNINKLDNGDNNAKKLKKHSGAIKSYTATSNPALHKRKEKQRGEKVLGSKLSNGTKNNACNDDGCACSIKSAEKFSFNTYKGELFKIVISFALLMAAIFIKIPNMFFINIVLYVLSYIICGGEYILKALKNIRRGKIFDENFLMTLATLCAVILGEFAEGVAVMLFYRVGEFFQELAVKRTRRSIVELMDVRPEFANLLIDGKEVRAQPEDVKKGDTIIIRPGEKIPVDCTVISGSAFINSSAITGESVPVRVTTGDKLYSGVINNDGVLTVVADKIFAQSTVSKILELVEQSSDKKAKAENFITKFAKVYTPIVVAIAAAVAFVPSIIYGFNVFPEWGYRALIFLIISCPCALVISIPLSFFGGIGGASARGILFKGANYLDAMSMLGTVVTDKTGTLTKGTFKVSKISPYNQTSEKELIETAVSVEKYSNHPIAKSLIKHYGKDIGADVTDYKEISGKGVTAKISGSQVYAGNKKLMEDVLTEVPDAADFGTIVYVAKDNSYLGYIVISDEIKMGGEEFVSDLKSAGVDKVIMLTGDSSSTAGYVSQKLKIDEHYAELTPVDKVEILEKIMGERQNGKNIAFIGDGINDAPVLTRADVGIAMGAIGSDAAIESADVVLMNDNLDSVKTAIRIAKKTKKIVVQNIVFALTFKIIIMILGLLNIATMWMAIFADVGVALLAVLNATRALRSKNL